MLNLCCLPEADPGADNTRTGEGQIFQLNVSCQRSLCVKTTFHSYLKIMISKPHYLSKTSCCNCANSICCLSLTILAIVCCCWPLIKYCLSWVNPNIIHYTEPIIVYDFHIKSASTYLCVRRKIVREKCTLKSCASFGMDGVISASKINRKVYGENGCANVPKVEAMDVIWKKVGGGEGVALYYHVVLVTISCAYSLPNSRKYPADGIVALCNCTLWTYNSRQKFLDTLHFVYSAINFHPSLRLKQCWFLEKYML